MIQVFIAVSLAVFALSVGPSYAQNPAPASKPNPLLTMIGLAPDTAVDSSKPARGGGTVVYAAPRLIDRIADPLEIRQASTPVIDFAGGAMKGATVLDIFNKTVNSDKYVLLEAARIVDPRHISSAVFWFAYIEKEKTEPQKKPVPQKNK